MYSSSEPLGRGNGNSSVNIDFAALAQPFAPNAVYLGLYDAFKNGTWVWSDGTPVDYKNWAEGRPDNSTGFEFCAQLHVSPVISH